MTSYESQAMFNNYSPVSIGWGGAFDPEAHPALLVDFSYNAVSFGKMHRDAVGLFRALLDELVPLIPGGLKAGSCGCYNPNSTLQDGSRSFHTWGIAIDVNWNVNHMGTDLPSPTGQYAIPHADAQRIAHKYGCEYGGTDWGSFNDDMHIEIHLPPRVAATVTPEVDMPLSADDLNKIAAVTKPTNAQGVHISFDTAIAARTNPLAAALGDAVKRLADLQTKVDALTKSGTGTPTSGTLTVTGGQLTIGPSK